MAGAQAADPLLDRNSGEAGAEEVDRLPARRGVARDQDDGTVPSAAESRVDARLADGRAVEAKVVEVAPRDRVAEDAVSRARARVHAHEQGGVASLLEELCVFGPFVLDDEFTARIQLFREE
jgi:hypothetical protein